MQILAKNKDKELTVKKWMSQNVITIEQDAPVSLAFELLLTNNIRHLPVVSKGGALVGIITDRDLSEALTPPTASHEKKANYLTVKNISAKKIMTPNPVTIEPATPVTEAAKILLDRKIDCLPVKDAEGHPIGILTSTDILKAFIKLSEILQEIQHIDIVMDSDQYDDVLELLKKWEVSVISVGITANNDLNRTVFSFRVKDADVGKLIKRLRKEGFSILPND